MEYRDIHDYYKTLICMANAQVATSKPDDRLTRKEVKFLTYCCIYQFNGNSLERFSTLAKYLIEEAGFKDSREVSVYKTKVATKKWIVGARDTFVLSKLFINPQEAKTFTISYVGT